MNPESEPVSRIKRLEKKYENETRIWIISLVLILILLIFFGFAQFAILDYFFKITFNIPDRARVFGIPSNNLLGFIATATLPITALIDQSDILNGKFNLTLPLIGRRISLMWIVFVADILLTSLAFFGTNQAIDANVPLIVFTSFMIGASFSTFILYLTKGMAAVGKKASATWQNLQVIKVYGIDPVPYGDDEKVRLSTEAEMARDETRKLRQRLEDSQLKYEQEIQSLKEKVSAYENYLGSLVQLKENFNQLKEMFQELTPKSQAFFDKFTAIEESISSFFVPRTEIFSGANFDKNRSSYRTVLETEPDDFIGEITVRDKSFIEIQARNQPKTDFLDIEHADSWHNITIPSEVSPPVINLLKGMEQQNFPPPQIGRYSPKNNLASCSVLQFEDYKIIVYFRDENYVRGDQWNSSDELKFKCKLIQQNMKGYIILHFTGQELIADPYSILDQIKSAIRMRQSTNFDES